MKNKKIIQISLLIINFIKVTYLNSMNTSNKDVKIKKKNEEDDLPFKKYTIKDGKITITEECKEPSSLLKFHPGNFLYDDENDEGLPLLEFSLLDLKSSYNQKINNNCIYHQQACNKNPQSNNFNLQKQNHKNKNELKYSYSVANSSQNLTEEQSNNQGNFF